MARRRKAAHVDADLRHHDLRAHVADSGHGDQSSDFFTKGIEGRTHLRIDTVDRFLQRFDLPKVQLEQEAMMRAYTTAERFDERLAVSA